MLAYAQTATTVEELRQSLRDTENFMRNVPGMQWVAAQFINASISQAMNGAFPLDHVAAKEMERLPAAHSRELVFSAQDAALRRLWQQGRIAYDIDPDAWDSIGSAEPRTVIPPQVRQSLPHPNPLLIFPDPLLLEHPGQQHRQRVVGVYVTGARRLATDPALKGAVNLDANDRRTVMCSTHHPDATAWSLTFASMVEDEDGRPVMYSPTVRDVVWTRTTLHLDREGITLADMANESLANFHEMRGALAIGNAKQDLPLLLARTINLLIYLGAENADLRPIPASRGGRTAPRSDRDKPGKVVGVGYQVGAQLRAWRSYERERGEHLGGTVRPHIRRAHHHTFKHGKGRKLSKVLWLWPIPINMRHGAEETTIVPIKG